MEMTADTSGKPYNKPKTTGDVRCRAPGKTISGHQFVDVTFSMAVSAWNLDIAGTKLAPGTKYYPKWRRGKKRSRVEQSRAITV